jgi:hypothetical protein
MTDKPEYREDLETGDRVHNDISEAIRWKYRLAHVRGRLLTKCPSCHGDFPDDEYAEHRKHCSGLLSQTDKRGTILNSSARKHQRLKRQPPKLKPQQPTCIYCGAAVRHDRIEKHLQFRCPKAPNKASLKPRSVTRKSHGHFCQWCGLPFSKRRLAERDGTSTAWKLHHAFKTSSKCRRCGKPAARGSSFCPKCA